ncbi:uncharacterized protein LOC132565403 [Ylistrum balloti]|uniref:uncharacterized protein LOC132565403 n=1 Tax=Ylistrum balloti TaxID=509963 RepID=UPI002905E02D|nr:uncharacterized protein LOC132565403 [Ylistrum balloti]
MTNLEIMEPQISFKESSSSDLLSSGVKMEPRPHSAPSRKILPPEENHSEIGRSSSSPVTRLNIQRSGPITGLEADVGMLSTGSENENDQMHIGNVNVVKHDSRHQKVLLPKHDEEKSDSLIKKKVSNKVFDTGKNYGHSVGGFSPGDIETMSDIDLMKESCLQLPPLPFEIINKDDRQLEDEEGMEVEEEMNVDHVEEIENMEESVLKGTVPVTKFRPGRIVYGTKEALVDMVQEMVALPEEESGIFVKECLLFLSSGEGTQVIRKKVLGRGSFGKVNLYVHDETYFVIKQITKDFQRNEVLLTAKLNSPYLVECHGLVVRNKIPEIIMEYGGQSMLQMARLRKFQDRDVWDITYQGLCALEYLEEHQICHHDLKPENLLLMVDNGQYLLKITDFGAAKLIDEKNDMIGWTVEYLSPERAWVVLLSKCPQQLKPTGQEDQDITGKSDIYSLALSLMYPYDRSHVLMKHITNGDNIYRDDDKQQELQLNLLVMLCSDLNLALNQMPKSVSTDMRFVLNKMLQGDVSNRCNAAEAKNWMNFLSNLAIQQRDKGVRIQDSSTPLDIDATTTKPVNQNKKFTATRKSAANAKKSLSPAVGTSQLQSGEEVGWVRDCKTATSETMANLPSGLKTRMVKRKLQNKVKQATDKKIKTNHNGEKQDNESCDTSGVPVPHTISTVQGSDVIVIDGDSEEDQEQESQQNEAPEVEPGNGNIPNLDMII